MTLQIRKKNNNTFEHHLGDKVYVFSKFRTKIGQFFELREDSSVRRLKVNILDVEVYDDTVGGSAETFSSSLLLAMRLKQLGYNG